MSGELEHLKELYKAYTRRLRILEVKKAEYGMETPPSILMEIEDLREKIAEIQPQITVQETSHNYSELQTTKVQILMTGEISQFTPEKQHATIAAIAAIAGIPTSQITFLKATPGSIILTLEIPIIAWLELALLLEDDSQELRDLGILKISRIDDDLDIKSLVEKILIGTRKYLECDNCTFFEALSTENSKQKVLYRWIKINIGTVLNNDYKLLSKENVDPVRRFFREKQGIAGWVLYDHQSRIIPHALESPEFVATPELTGGDLSMLAVAVKSHFSIEGEQQIIGVIVCYKREANYFTADDCKTLESVAQLTATILERGLSPKSSNSLGDDDKVED